MASENTWACMLNNYAHDRAIDFCIDCYCRAEGIYYIDCESGILPLTQVAALLWPAAGSGFSLRNAIRIGIDVV